MYSSSTLQYYDKGPWVRQVTDDHHVSFISEWCSPVLVHIFGFLVIQDMRELEGFRQRSDESISSFISRWRGKIAEIVD